MKKAKYESLMQNEMKTYYCHRGLATVTVEAASPAAAAVVAGPRLEEILALHEDESEWGSDITVEDGDGRGGTFAAESSTE